MLKRVMVTGGSGLVGSSLKDLANEYSDREFTFLSSRDVDLTNLESTLAFVRHWQPDAILHLAAVAGGIGFSIKYPATLLRDNVMMNLNVLEAARICGVPKTLMSLSTGMYPVDAPNPIREEYIHDGPAHPSNYSYSYAKRLIEPSIHAYRTEYDLNVIGVVPNGIFGEHSNYDPESAHMVASLIRRFYENRAGSEPLMIWGDGSPLREYTYAADIARACMWCLDNYDGAQILHVGSTEEHSVKETAYMIAEIMGIDSKRIAFDTSKPAGIYKKSTDNSRFTQLSGFQYTPFRTGLEYTIRWFIENYNDPIKVRKQTYAAAFAQ